MIGRSSTSTGDTIPIISIRFHPLLVEMSLMSSWIESLVQLYPGIDYWLRMSRLVRLGYFITLIVRSNLAGGLVTFIRVSLTLVT
jgi:hypothetical protein